MFHQSGGCCDGSSPMCYLEGEFRTGGRMCCSPSWRSRRGRAGQLLDVDRDQFERWRHTHLTVDVVPGRGSGFSLEAPEGVRFLIRSRLLTPEENAVLNPEAPAR